MLERNFINLGLNDQDKNKKDKEEWPKKVNLIRDWDDENLPKVLDAFAWETVYKGKKNDPEIKDFRFDRFEGVDFGIPQHKLDGLELAPEDIVRVMKLDFQGSAYDGDGIVKITNCSKNISRSVADWRKQQ